MFPFSPILLEEAALSAILGITLILFAIMSFTFSYHWRRFGIHTAFFRRMNRLYFLISGSLAILSVLLFVAILKSM
jgi:uncharacterized membrane protein